MAKEDYVVAIDIGSTKVVAIVGKIQEGITQVVGFGKASNAGLRRGTIVDIEETVSSISSAIEEAEQSAGVELTQCYGSIGGNQIISVDSKGVIAVSRADGEIQPIDIERVVDAARSVALPPNYEILHINAKNFAVDGQTSIKDPTGMSGIRLETNAHVIGVSTIALKNLTRAITQSGLSVDGIVFSALAAANAYLSKKQREIGSILIDIGASGTSIAVFEEGTLLHSKVIPIGSNHITNDIAIGLKITLESAEKVKLNEVTLDSDNVNESTKVDLSKYDKNEKERPSQKYICEIAEARLNEIFSLIKQELSDIERDEMLPAGAVLVGGGAKLEGIESFTKKHLGLPAQMGKPFMEISGIIDKLDDPEYATAVGLMLWGLDETQINVSNRPRIDLNIGSLGGALDKVKDIFKNFIP